MSETPFRDALEKAGVNTLLVEGRASQVGGGAVVVTVQREKGSLAGGVSGGVSQAHGWGIAGFFKKVWK